MLKEGRLTLEDLHEFEARPENQGKLFELIEGEIIEKMASFLPSAIAQQVAFALMLYLKQNPLGYLTGSDGGYIMPDGSRLIPDVGYISKARLPEIPPREVPLPPDLAVEVVSPTDDLREVQKKARLYLRHGVQVVWVVYPEDQTLDIYTAAEGGVLVQTLGPEDKLTCPALLPDFTLPLAEVFQL
jgi:Uma2 family endonuclease